ncbi:MAG: hypothetical protein IJI10_04660 [Eubacterium sp.]|nr:hypothetical protein [Eubacterium sp.]
MDNRYFRKIGMIGILCFICMIFGISGKPAMAETAVTETAQDGKQLVIDVVEEIPAEEITEAAVPLGALPDTPARSNVRHAVLMGVFLACVLGYFLYFRSYKQHLRVLRETAEQKGYELLRRKRKEGQV